MGSWRALAAALLPVLPVAERRRSGAHDHGCLPLGRGQPEKDRRGQVVLSPFPTRTVPRWRAAALLPALALSLAALAVGAAPRGSGNALQLAEGVYMVAGTGGVADAANRGRIGNTGFIVGASGVIVVDTGTSFEQGRALLAAVRDVTDKPVQLVVITHVRPEFLFGANAFRAAGIPVLMQTRASRLMTARCETCLKVLRQTLGDETMRGTGIFKPDREFDDSLVLDAGARPVHLLYFGPSSGPGDVAVFDPRSRVLFAGGLLDQRRIPDIQDSDLEGWRQALLRLRALQPARIVPGHGTAGGTEIIDAVEAYLAQLEQKARNLVQTGVSLIDVSEVLLLPDFSGWDQYDVIHRRNASIAYLRIEREVFLK